MAASLRLNEKAMDPSGSFFMARLLHLRTWVHDREEARINKDVECTPRPWTKNKIIQSTRFCNVRRMDDRVSVWLRLNWYPPHTINNAATTLAAAGLARLINWPESLAALRDTRFHFFSKWDREKTTNHLNSIKARGGKVFTGAYIITAAGARPGDSKIDYVMRQIDTLYKHPELLVPESMEATHAELQKVPGIGSFIAGQIVADLRHVYPGAWKDKMQWAPLGPGSRRGIAWLQGWNGEDKLPRLKQKDFEYLLDFLKLFFLSDPTLKEIFDDRRLEMHDLQNCLCEFDKYMRLMNSTGRAKNKFNGV